MLFLTPFAPLFLLFHSPPSPFFLPVTAFLCYSSPIPSLWPCTSSVMAPLFSPKSVTTCQSALFPISRSFMSSWLLSAHPPPPPHTHHQPPCPHHTLSASPISLNLVISTPSLCFGLVSNSHAPQTVPPLPLSLPLFLPFSLRLLACQRDRREGSV